MLVNIPKHLPDLLKTILNNERNIQSIPIILKIYEKFFVCQSTLGNQKLNLYIITLKTNPEPQAIVPAFKN